VSPPVLWVTDFGLARLGDNAGLTMTGDLLGTIRYMSPEQALAQRVAVDARTDVYSLGATLYELLTLEPAYNCRSRQEVLRQIAFEGPRPPRRMNPAVPAELETIVLKAMGKNPEERYATAQELADDLRRWLEDRPIKARRPSLRQRAAKWARRHKTVVRAAGVVVVLAVVALAVSTVLIWRAKEGLNEANAELHRTLERERVNSYFQRIALAEREWTANNFRRYDQLLRDCPEDLRGWEWHYLRRLRVAGFPPLRHDSPVRCAAFSPDGRWIASTETAGVVRLWDATTGQELHKIPKAHAGTVHSLAFSPDSRCLASGARDGLVKLWDAKTGRELRTLEGHAVQVYSVAFSPDGQRLASCGGAPQVGGEVKIWDLSGGGVVALSNSSPYVFCVRFSPDGRRLAAGSIQKVTVWDVQSGQELVRARAGTSSTSNPYRRGVIR
jgi:hypothetical protein